MDQGRSCDSREASRNSLRVASEKVTRKVGGAEFSLNLFVLVDIVDAVVLGATANVFEGLKTRGSGCVGVDVDGIGTLDVLEKSHGSVTCVVLHHFGVWLTCTNIMGWVLENASLAISALGRMLEEVLTDRSEVLLAKTLLLHELVLAVGKAAALIFLTVLALLTLEPEATKLGLDLLFPCGLGFSSLLVGAREFTVQTLAVKVSDLLILRRVLAAL